MSHEYFYSKTLMNSRIGHGEKCLEAEKDLSGGLIGGLFFVTASEKTVKVSVGLKVFLYRYSKL